MSKKVAVWVVIIIILILGLFWWWYRNQTSGTSPSGNYPATSQTNDNGISAQTTSDASLNQDMASLDTQFKALDTDSQNADKGLNDKQIPQN